MSKEEKRRVARRILDTAFFNSVREFFGSEDPAIVAGSKARLDEAVATMLNSVALKEAEGQDGNIVQEMDGIMAVGGENAKLLSRFLNEFSFHGCGDDAVARIKEKVVERKTAKGKKGLTDRML